MSTILQSLILTAFMLFSRWIWAEASLPPADFFFSSGVTEYYALSADGTLLAALSQGVGKGNLRVGGVQGWPETSKVINPSQGSVVCFFWFDGNKIGYQSRSNDGRLVFGLMQIKVDGGVVDVEEIHQVDWREGLVSVVGPRSTDTNPEGLVVRVADEEGDREKICELNLNNGVRRDLLEESVGFVQCVSSIASDEIALLIYRNGLKELLVSRGGVVKLLATGQMNETIKPVGFGDGGRLLWVLSNRGEGVDKIRLEEWDWASGVMSVLHSDPKDEVDLDAPLIARSGDEVIGACYRRDRLEICILDKKNRDLLGSFKDGPYENVDCFLLGSDIRQRKWIVSFQSDTMPEALYLLDLDSGKWTYLSGGFVIKNEFEMANMKPFRFEARDGKELMGYITHASVDEGVEGLPPAVLFVHGGPRMRNYWGYDPRVQFLASRGYTVIQVNFRGSEGFGKKFAEEGNRQMGIGCMQDDLTDTVNHFIKSGVIDPGRVAIFGGSYGGYTTLAGMVFTPDLFAAGVGFFGPSDLESFVKNLQPSWQSYKDELHLMMGDPEDADGVRRLRLQSPLHHVQKIKKPLMILHGRLDELVPVEHSDSFAGKAIGLGKQIDYFSPEDMGHGFSGVRDEALAFVAVEHFLHRHLGGRIGYIDPEDLEEIENWRGMARRHLPGQ